MSAKILILDIETSPMLAHLWSLFDRYTPPDRIVEDWYIMTWSAKWHGTDEIMSDSLHYYGPNITEDDQPLLKSLFPLLDEADVVVAHNGRRFDGPKINTRFVMNNMTPPSPFKMVDTLDVAKKHFRFSSNKLDFLAHQLVGTGKLNRKFEGFRLWKECIDGNPEAWEEMVHYNKVDVDILEKVYVKLLPWTDNHPNVALLSGNLQRPSCPKCGSNSIQLRGHYHTTTGKYQRFVCNECGGWSRSRFTELRKEDSKGILVNAAMR